VVVAGEIEVLVRMPVLVLAALHLVERVAALGPRAELGVAVPEIGRQLGEAGVEEGGIVERAGVLVVLRGDGLDRRLDAAGDVRRDERDRFLAVLAERHDRGEDLVVRDRALAAAFRDTRAKRQRLEVEPAARAALKLEALRMAKLDAVLDVPSVAVLDQLVDE